MSDLVGNPEDRFSRVAVQMVLTMKMEQQAAQCSYFSYFFPIFSGLPIFSYILIPNPIFFHQTPIFFKMLQIIMKYQGKIMEFWFEMPVLMSLAFIFFFARS